MEVTPLIDTGENLIVNKQYYRTFSVDDFDNIQSKYDMIASNGEDAGTLLSNQFDADILAEVLNATSTVDAGDL